MSYMVCHGMKSKAGDIKNIEKHIYNFVVLCYIVIVVSNQNGTGYSNYRRSVSGRSVRFLVSGENYKYPLWDRRLL